MTFLDIVALRVDFESCLVLILPRIVRNLPDDTVKPRDFTTPKLRAVLPYAVV